VGVTVALEDQQLVSAKGPSLSAKPIRKVYPQMNRAAAENIADGFANPQ